MKVTDIKDKLAMLAYIIDPYNFTLWSSYVEGIMKEEGKSYEEAIKMADYNFRKDIELANTKALLILKLLDKEY